MPYKNPEDKKAWNKLYQKRNRKKINAQHLKSQKLWREENKDILPEFYKRRNLRTKYGMTLEEYNEMLAEQGGCCDICGVHQSAVKQVFHVDHDHKTEKIRGILCLRCNIALGYVSDNIDILKEMIIYLERNNNG